MSGPSALDPAGGGGAATGAPPDPAAPPPAATSAPTPPDLSSGCAGTAVAPGNHDWTLASGGRSRVARVHVPPAYDGKKPVPVVLNFHGRLSSPAQEEAISEMTPKSDAAGFVVVYPTGVGQTWNAGYCCGEAQTQNVDDVGFTRALLDELGTKLCIDKRRIFATGLSNGGFMSHRLACELSDRIAAIGPVAGHANLATCAPARAVPVMHFHGTADNLVPYPGGFGMVSVEDSMKAWAKRNGCAATTKPTYTKGDARCVTYDGCPVGGDVTLCTIADGGHTWPGGAPVPYLGKTSQDLDATDAMWTFFEAHPLP